MPTTVKVRIVAWHENYQPGIVECSLIDRFGRDWRFSIKQVYASSVDLGEDSPYPLPGAVDCIVLERGTDAADRPTVRVEIDPPIVNLTQDGVDQFDLYADSVADSPH